MIRKARTDDIPAVGELLRQVLRVHHNGRPDLFAAEGKKYTDAEIADILSCLDTPVFVYCDGDAVKGYIFCRLERHSAINETPHTTLYIDDLCVDEKARGQHIGRSLYEYARRFAAENGCYNITLHVWECNPSARAFYEKLGLRPQFTSLEEIL